MEKTASDILLEAATLLEEDNRWHKGYYQITENGCAMCAHTAIAYCGNPIVREKLSKPSPTMVIPMVDRGYQSSSQTDQPVELAHQRAKQVGLTYDYNDDLKTTKQDVINKLREAAQLT